MKTTRAAPAAITSPRCAPCAIRSPGPTPSCSPPRSTTHRRARWADPSRRPQSRAQASVAGGSVSRTATAFGPNTGDAVGLLQTNLRPASAIRSQRLRAVRWRSDREPCLLASQRECQAGNNEGRKKDRQRRLSAASEGNGVAVGGVEGPSSAGVSPIADLQGVASRFDWYLDRVVQVD